MGCWNNTCNVTNLPIKYEEEVALIFLVDTSDANLGFTYNPDDNFLMFAFPIFGKYDDYGAIKDIEYDSNIWNFIQKQELYIYESKKRKIFHTKSMQEFIECVCGDNVFIKFKDRVFTKDNKPKLKTVYKQISTFMMHKEVYELIINYEYNKIPYNRKSCFGDLYKEWLVKQEKISRKIFLEQKKLQEENEKSSNPFAFLWDLERNAKISDNSSTRKIPSIVNELFLNSDKLSDEEILQIVNYKLLIKGLFSLRKGFFVSSGLGSQKQEYFLHKLLAEWTLKKIQSVYEFYKKEDETATEKDILADEEYFFYDYD